MPDDTTEKRIDKIEDQQKIFIEDIATIKNEVSTIKKDSSEIKESVQSIQKDLIKRDKDFLKETAKISNDFSNAIQGFKTDMHNILAVKLEGHYVKEERVEKLEEFQDVHEKLHENMSGQYKGIRKIIHYIWAPFVIILYVIWDKFLSKMISRLFE